jgi:hypothetical protein
MAGRIYTIPMDAVAVTAVQDLFEIVSGSAAVTRLLAVYVGQSSDAGDAEDEQLRVQIIRAASTSGSGGASVTPAPLFAGDTAFTGTAERNNTTQATGGSPVTLLADTFNVRAGWVYRPTEREIITIAPSVRLAIALPAAPADSLTMSGYCVIEEIG